MANHDSSNVLNYQAILSSFSIHLQSTGASKKTIQNYNSDITHYLSFVEIKLASDIRTPQSFHNLLNLPLIHGYISAQQSTITPITTTNRRLSSLRSLIRWAYEKSYLSQDISDHFKNLHENPDSKNINADHYEDILEEWSLHLSKSGASKVTIKNYRTDIRKFIAWIEANTEKML